MAGSGDREYACCVPVYTDKLAMLSDDVGTLLEVRWARREEEHEWETEAVAVADHPDDDGLDATERQLALACQISSHMVRTEHLLASMLRFIGDELRQAVAADVDNRRRRPHPGTAAWWHQRGLRHGRGGLRHTRFVQVSRQEMARAQELVADASKRAQRLRAHAEDLDRDCWPPSAATANAAVVHSTPRLMERLRRAQRLADAILIPLHPLKRLLDHHLIGTNEPCRHGKRGRATSVTPPRVADANPRPMIRRRSI